MSAPKIPLEDRFWAHVIKGPDCWECTYTPSQRYPVVKVNGKDVKASHVAWELGYGEPFPVDRLACHTCDNTRCVRLSHLYAGTPMDNVHDILDRDRNPRKNQETCKRGHNEWKVSQTRGYKGKVRRPYRQCMACMREAARNR